MQLVAAEGEFLPPASSPAASTAGHLSWSDGMLRQLDGGAQLDGEAVRYRC